MEWTRYSGDDVEAAVSMFVCRENPEALRIRPSIGDGGIDVYVPVSPGHVEIYQVKKFADNLEDSEKRQIRKSHKRIQKYALEKGWTVDRWYLTLPLDPTKENLDWLAGLEKEGPFPCRWRGLAHIEGWGSKHRDIVDYYFHDGRDRLEEQVAKFVRISGIQMANPAAITPEDFANLAPGMVQEQLAVLRDTLNERDPHFSYDISVSERPTSPPSETDGYPVTVASRTQLIGGSYVTFHVLANCAEAVEERPIDFQATFVAKDGSVEQRELGEFLDYGRIPRVPLEIRSFSVEMPGGLGGKLESGVARLFEPAPGEGVDRRLCLLSPEGEMLADVVVHMSAPSINHDNTGFSTRCTDSAGFLEVELLTKLRDDGSTDITVRLHRGDPTGHFPDHVEQSLAFSRHFTAPNLFRISSPRVVAQQITQEVPPRVPDPDRDALEELLLRYVRALMVIQRHAPIEIKIPDVDVESLAAMREVIQAARLLDGEVADVTWNASALTLEPGALAPTLDGIAQIDVVHDFHVVVGANAIPLGVVQTTLKHAKIAEHRASGEGEIEVVVAPASENQNTARRRWLGMSLDTLPLEFDGQAVDRLWPTQ